MVQLSVRISHLVRVSPSFIRVQVVHGGST